jgi:diguanylate cyclase (GGDEF)-like protein
MTVDAAHAKANELDAMLAEVSKAEAAGDHDAGLLLCARALELAQALGQPARQAHVLRIRGRFLTWKGALEAAIASCDEGRKLLSDVDDEREYCQLCVVQAFALSGLGLGEEAMELLAVAREIAERLRDRELLFWVHNRIGLAYDSFGDSRAARELMLQALVLSDAVDDTARWSIMTNLVHNAMSFVVDLRSKGEQDEADRILAEALEHAVWAVDFCIQANRPYGLSLGLGNLGAIQSLAGEPEQALQTLSRAHQLAVEHGYRPLEMSALQHKPTTLLSQGRVDEAVELLEDVLSRAEDLGEQPVQVAVLRQLADVYEQRGEFEKALASYKRFYNVEQLVRSARAETRARILAHQAQLERARIEAADARAHSEQLLADKLALQKQTLELERHAYSDALTGIANRRYVDATLPGLYEQARSQRREMCVAVMDLDHFKQVNDTFGHPIGDEVLIKIAQLIISNSRSADLVARHGGEEFLMAFVDSDLAAAARLCERLRASVEATDWALIKPSLKITMSVGICAAADCSDAAELIDRADRQLYRAKAQGRNRVAHDWPSDSVVRDIRRPA